MSTSLRRSAALTLLSGGALAVAGLVTATPAAAAPPAGPSGPVIVDGAQWLLRTTPSGGNPVRGGGPAGLDPVAGNFDPADDEYEVGVVLYDDVTGQLTWQIRRDLAPTSPVVSFTYGRTTDTPVVGDWDGNGTDTPAVLRNIPATNAEGPFQQWLYRYSTSAGAASGSFVFGGAAQSLDRPIEFIPRLAVEIGAA